MKVTTWDQEISRPELEGNKVGKAPVSMFSSVTNITIQ